MSVQAIQSGDLVRVLSGWHSQTTARVLDVSAPSVKLVDYAGHIFYLRGRHIEELKVLQRRSSDRLS
jgi:hypothetical protein